MGRQEVEANQQPAVLSTEQLSSGNPRVIAYRPSSTRLSSRPLSSSQPVHDSMMATEEAMEDVQIGTKRLSIDMESLKRKKFKADDLPISASQHAAIDKLLHSFKKKGGFDSIRKQIWAEFNDGVWSSSDEAMRFTSASQKVLTHLHRIRRPTSRTS